jgi:hypothetical protein
MPGGILRKQIPRPQQKTPIGLGMTPPRLRGFEVGMTLCFLLDGEGGVPLKADAWRNFRKQIPHARQKASVAFGMTRLGSESMKVNAWRNFQKAGNS